MVPQLERQAVLHGVDEQSLEVEREIAQWARVCLFPEDEIAKIRIAVKEAVTNAYFHGNRQDPTKRVLVEYSVNNEEVRVRVSDEGTGFDPAEVPDPKAPERLTEPGGRGLLLLRELMTGVQYSPTGNQVEFWKRR